MSWEAFLGALLPAIVSTLAAIAAYFRSGHAAARSDVAAGQASDAAAYASDTAASAGRIAVSAEARIEIVKRLEKKLDLILSRLDEAKEKTP